ncbi:hypothetical protein AMAG_06951 [Allomyces macrogynus ATCC 38327]|uniref:Bidirectional sugar transporter SWEET n=1 Tax=Allomyces macrogynus (strain ATCC 38327) TaxID=578462 RepID=A0A0L0SFC3_ALLM3|nr:hypothetical protein AMAG_06951 [Allomyces macrogynus ATCC 38327]|eukprot:KNE61201.1 hypothetical protein AMAG_06951 [Allomyces macrogynus ATCC 38327]
MSSASDVLLKWVVPVCGNTTAILLSLSPLPTVLQLRKTGKLGTNNPLPYAFVYANALVWVVYGLLKKDYWVCIPNMIGVLLGQFYVHTAYGLANPRQKLQMDLVAIGSSFVVYLLATIVFLGMPYEAGQLAMGILTIVIQVLYYGSPLSTLVEVVRTRNSVHFLLPLALMGVINGGFWTVYGFFVVAKADLFIWLPNVVGTTFAAIQMLCRLVFPAHPVTGGAVDLEKAQSPRNSVVRPQSPRSSTIRAAGPQSPRSSTVRAGMA